MQPIERRRASCAAANSSRVPCSLKYWCTQTDLPAERPARARSEVWPRSQTQSSRPCWAWSEPCHSLWASLRTGSTKNVQKKSHNKLRESKSVLKLVCSCLQVCSRPHPGGAACSVAVVRGSVCMQLRAETPCSTAAAAAEEEAEAEEVQAQPSSSRRITGRHTSHAIYTRQRAHTDVHAQVHIQHTHTHTSKHLRGQWAVSQQSPGLFSCSCDVLLLLRKKRISGGPISTFTYIQYSTATVHQHARRTKETQHCTQTNNVSCDSEQWHSDLSMTSISDIPNLDYSSSCVNMTQEKCCWTLISCWRGVVIIWYHRSKLEWRSVECTPQSP